MAGEPSRAQRRVGMPAHKTQSGPVSSGRVGGMNIESGISRQALHSDRRSRRARRTTKCHSNALGQLVSVGLA